LAEANYVSVSVSATWGDCDPAGLAFSSRYFMWMDQSSHVLARRMGVSARDMVPPTLLGFPLVSAQCDFLQPVRMGDELEVRTWVKRIGRSSLALRHEIRRKADNQVVAEGNEERVFVGRDENRALKSRELSPEMRAVLESFSE
jgi:YbgC/YbaW family acyl-CoA thioester hydrolase